MKIKLKNIKKNPHRDFELNPLNEEKTKKLIESIKHTEFWNNLLARKKGETYELAYGHHRLEALKRTYGGDHEIELLTRDLNDETMLKIMLDENNNWFGNSANKHEGIKAAKKLHPSYTNKQIASLLNIDSNLVANYNQITEAIKNNLIDKSIISKINTYQDIGVLSSVANEHAIKYKNILEVHKKALADSRKNSKTGKITKTNVLTAIQQIDSVNSNNKEDKEEKLVQLYGAIGRAKDLVFEAKNEVLKVWTFKDQIKNNKELFEINTLMREIENFKNNTEPILLAYKNKTPINNLITSKL
tara:strand:+ start:363 stop:1268 length:906 start_codon:yes stop_codon:yes gene_type:complete